MFVYCNNPFYAQKLQKQAHNKDVKPKSYIFNNKDWLNSKFIKTKQNRKLEAKFFKLLQVLHLIKKQVYKLEFSKKKKIFDFFYMLLLKQAITRKRQIKETQLELDISNKKKYKVEAI